jgi:hypothetical protein
VSRAALASSTFASVLLIAAQTSSYDGFATAKAVDVIAVITIVARIFFNVFMGVNLIVDKQNIDT